MTTKQLTGKLVKQLKALNKKDEVKTADITGDTVINKIVSNKDGYMEATTKNAFKAAASLTVYHNTEPKTKARWPKDWETYTIAQLAEKFLA